MRVYLDPSQEIAGGQVFKNLLIQQGVQLVDHNNYDLLILDGGSSDTARGYLAALALAQRKPVFCFIPKGFPVPEVFEEIGESKELQKLFKLFFYTKDSLEKVTEQALQLLGAKIMGEKPIIKFTLRITPSMEHYLEWKSSQTGLSKADFLRQQIQEKIIDKDEKFSDML